MRIKSKSTKKDAERVKKERSNEQMLNNIIFMGTPEFAVPTLELLSKTKYKPILCVTQPDRLKGRKKRLLPSVVKIKALELNIPLIQPENINSPESIEELKKINPDIIVTVAYGGYLKREIRKLPKFGCINLHPSLLPKYRGSAPVNYTLFNNEKFTGNTIFKIFAKMDAGPIIYQRKIAMKENECFTGLTEKLSKLGAEDVLKVLEKIENNDYELIKQDDSKATFSHKIEKQDLLLDWSLTAEKIRNKVRGLAVRPGTVASFRNKRIKIIETEILQSESISKPGTVIDIIKNVGIVVATVDFDLLLKKVQPEGKKIMNAYAFYIGALIRTGERLDNGF